MHEAKSLRGTCCPVSMARSEFRAFPTLVAGIDDN